MNFFNRLIIVFVLFSLVGCQNKTDENEEVVGWGSNDFGQIDTPSGLKNIQSRLKVIHGDILFEHDSAQSFFKVTIDIPKEISER